MKNTIGNAITVTLFGESHAEEIGAVIDGIAPGVKIDHDYIEKKLWQRKARGKISTARHEEDHVRFICGVFNGYTTGTPLTLIIENANTKSADYEWMRQTPRPGHADYTAECKYHGYQDYRGGGHFSGRLTAALVAAGAVLASALEQKNIFIGSRIKRLCGITDQGEISGANDIRILNTKDFPTLCDRSGEDMIKKIEDAATVGDSVGGILETAVLALYPVSESRGLTRWKAFFLTFCSPFLRSREWNSDSDSDLRIYTAVRQMMPLQPTMIKSSRKPTTTAEYLAASQTVCR